MEEVLKPDLCVIGAGSGGLSVAAAAAQFGVPVVLIEKGLMGGDCLNYGCVPSKALLAAGAPVPKANDPLHKLVLPAYDQCIKASHVFNLLDARGVISVTERQSYILRVRELAKACCAAWLQTEGGGA